MDIMPSNCSEWVLLGDRSYPFVGIYNAKQTLLTHCSRCYEPMMYCSNTRTTRESRRSRRRRTSMSVTAHHSALEISPCSIFWTWYPNLLTWLGLARAKVHSLAKWITVASAENRTWTSRMGTEVDSHYTTAPKRQLEGPGHQASRQEEKVIWLCLLRWGIVCESYL